MACHSRAELSQAVGNQAISSKKRCNSPWSISGPTRVPYRDGRPELDPHGAMAIGELVRVRDPDEWKRPDRGVPEKGGGSRREILFRDHGEPLLTGLHSHEPLLRETHRADGCFAHHLGIAR
jgi:hypothetical protein